jgi:hypothetical protein
MRSFHNNQPQSVEEKIFLAIQSKELDPEVCLDFLTSCYDREWNYLETISVTLEYSEICKRKNALYQVKLLIRFIRWCQGVDSQSFKNLE